MNTSDTPTRSQPAHSATHELRFSSLFHTGRGVSIPCDASGSVNLDALSERMRVAYLCARAMMGRDYAYPTVERVH